MTEKLNDYEYSILDEIRRDEINQALKLKDLVEEQIVFQRSINPQNYSSSSLLHILQSLLDDSTKNEEV